MSELLAFEYYRVERVHAGGLDRPLPPKKGFLGRRKPDANIVDQIRILDRDGVVVWQQFGAPESAHAQETQIVDDLLSLDVAAFRAKWGIATP